MCTVCSQVNESLVYHSPPPGPFNSPLFIPVQINSKSEYPRVKITKEINLSTGSTLINGLRKYLIIHLLGRVAEEISRKIRSFGSCNIASFLFNLRL